MSDTITVDQIQHHFRTEMWRDHLTALSESLGFSLSVYSRTGTLIVASRGAVSLCPLSRLHSPAIAPQCATYCLPLAQNTLKTGKPDIFKCHKKIMTFALPVEYMNEHAVILGRGSFATYADFREYMNSVLSEELSAMSLPVPASFTSYEQAWKVCGFVSDSVNRLLKSTQETENLRKKFERLKNIIGMWGVSDEEQPEDLYRSMIHKLALLLEADRISLLVDQKNQGVYANHPGMENGNEPRESFSISDRDPMVMDLIAGKAFVCSHTPESAEARYFFPIMADNKLEGLLLISSRRLTEGDKNIITAFCRQAALSLENRRLHRRLSGKFDRFAAISELTKSITPIQNYDTLLRTILDMSAYLLKAERGSLMLLDQETDALLLEAKKGIIDGVADNLRISRGEGIAGTVAKSGEPILVEDLENDPRIKQKKRQNYKTRSFVSVPLKIDDRIIGVLNLADKVSGGVFDEDDLKLIQSFATHAAIVMERQVFINKTEELKKLTITDPLTGLLNRRYLSERLKNELSRSDRHAHPLSLLMLDLDGFKKCNDSLGHLFGDGILKNIAETLVHTVRSMDIVARYGGDEFMIILPETGEALATDIAERVRTNIKRQMSLHRNAASAEPHSLTASIGVVCFPEHGKTVELLLENVDKALYRAKKKGKNRVEVFA